jgi:superfamily II DNA or RNA helicase
MTDGEGGDSSGEGFLSPDYLHGVGSSGLTRVVQRMCLHSGFSEAWNVDGPGDKGADIIGVRGDRKWVIQSKWKKTYPAGPEAIDEVRQAQRHFKADCAAAVTNLTFSRRAIEAANRFSAAGTPIQLIDGPELSKLYQSNSFLSHLPAKDLRPYQINAVKQLRTALERTSKALLVMATGLGKTVVAGEVISQHLRDHPGANVLVIAHQDVLVRQLEQSLWSHIPKEVRTHVLSGGHEPENIDGLACATIQSARKYVDAGYVPDLVFVDEAHHVGADNVLASVLDDLEGTLQVGATATPWRGDKYDISSHFGPPAFELGIAEGMALGYLSTVNYRLFTSDVDWDAVSKKTGGRYSVRDLNSKLFLPQLDENVRDELIGSWEKKARPRAIVFCKTIEHATRMAKLLNAVPQFRGASCVHAQMTMRERQQEILRFREGIVPVITAVDILNEGVDVPDVNIVCFVRVTHSRRIFVQQLGRGLRISDEKNSVEVLDFVSDIRRVAALVSLERDLAEYPGGGQDVREVLLPAGHRIEFVDQQAGELMREWLKDAANVETARDEAQLEFPPLSL